jgi:hypothetical protein
MGTAHSASTSSEANSGTEMCTTLPSLLHSLSVAEPAIARTIIKGVSQHHGGYATAQTFVALTRQPYPLPAHRLSCRLPCLSRALLHPSCCNTQHLDSATSL